MFFTHLGRVVAILALVIGIWNVVGGLMVANDMWGPYEAAMARYFPQSQSSGAVIDMGTYYVVFALALGV